jgi:hypothetical protein
VGQEQRAAQRIDLPEPVSGKIGDIEVKIVDVSLVGSRIEHVERVAMGATMPLRFNWRGEAMLIRAKVTRTEMRSIGGKMVYSTGVQFANSVDESPDAVRKIMASLVKTSVADKPPAEVPIFFERAPFFRDEEPDEPKPAKPAHAAPRAAPAQAPPPAPQRQPHPAPAAALAMGDGEPVADFVAPDYELDFAPTAAATHYDFDIAPAVASQSFELEGEALLTVDDISIPDVAMSRSFELEVEQAKPVFARCAFEEGKWSVERTAEPKQPREGFTIVDPGDQREIDQFCKTYEYADPETRRMIRVSCELMIAQQH